MLVDRVEYLRQVDQHCFDQEYVVDSVELGKEVYAPAGSLAAQIIQRYKFDLETGGGFPEEVRRLLDSGAAFLRDILSDG